MIASVKFSIGIGKTKDGETITDLDKPEEGSWLNAVIESILTCVAQAFGGFTVHYAKGGWYDEKRKVLVRESCVVIEAANTSLLSRADIAARADAIAKTANEALNQECTLVTFYEGRNELI